MYKITSSTLPDIYPLVGYQDKRYTTNRPIHVGMTSEVYRTSDKWQLISDSWYKQRNAQAILYNKYQFQLAAKEDSGVDLLAYADNVRIENLDTGEIHNAEVIDVSYRQLSSTLNRMYTITYNDTNPVNYKDYEQPVNNFLEREFLLEKYDTSGLTAIELYCGSTDGIVSGSINEANKYTFYSLIKPKQIITAPEVKSTTVDGSEKRTKVTNQNGYTCLFYCKEDEKNALVNYMPIITSNFSGYNYYALLKYESVYIQIIEGVNPVVKEIGAGLYEVELTMKTTNNIHYPYV